MRKRERLPVSSSSSWEMMFTVGRCKEAAARGNFW